ncbi:hypothetical protein [Ralstonia pseudosolanacearum]|uniref:hypothetical protein n=1 Tax=Ralstonia pseudosolanacearum TaxID=1310165 RepID=UPI003AAC666E
MSHTLFELHVPQVCPDEYAALCETAETYRTLALRFLDGASEVSEADCLAAKDRADRAELQARAAFRAAWPSQASTGVAPA